MPKDDKTMFDDVCKGHFERIEKGQTDLATEVRTLSDRLFKTNGKRAIVTCIEDNKEELKRITQKIDEHITVDTPTPAKTVKQMKLGKDGIVIQGVSGSDMIKILLLVVLILYVVGSDHLPPVIEKLFMDDHTEAVRPNE